MCYSVVRVMFEPDFIMSHHGNGLFVIDPHMETAHALAEIRALLYLHWVYIPLKHYQCINILFLCAADVRRTALGQYMTLCFAGLLQFTLNSEAYSVWYGRWLKKYVIYDELKKL